MPEGYVKLRNGRTVSTVLLRFVIASLDGLYRHDPTAFYELVMSCRDREHRIDDSASARLVGRNLVEGVDENGRGRIHDEVRSIVLAATEGEDPNLRMVSPLSA